MGRPDRDNLRGRREQDARVVDDEHDRLNVVAAFRHDRVLHQHLHLLQNS